MILALAKRTESSSTTCFTELGERLPGKRVGQRLEPGVYKCEVTMRRQTAERLSIDVADDRRDAIQPAVDVCQRQPQPI